MRPCITRIGVVTYTVPQLNPAPMNPQHQDKNERWQKALLPFMRWIIFALIVFYLAVSLFEFVSLKNNIENKRSFNHGELISLLKGSAEQNQASVDNVTARIYLEAFVAENRQRNFELFLVSRTWIKYVGFITGMIMCMVGAIFILGKISTGRDSSGEFEYGELKGTLKSSSPGLFMAFFGTTLLLSTILSNNQIEKNDGATYIYPDYTFVEDSAAAKAKAVVTDLGGRDSAGPNPNIEPPRGE